MRVSSEAIVRACSTGQVPAQPYVRGSGNRNGNEDSGADHAGGERQRIRGATRRLPEASARTWIELRGS